MFAYASFSTAAGSFKKFTFNKKLRNAFRDGSLNQPKIAVKNERGFKLKMDIKGLNFNDQILVINSSLLGDKAKDNNSFTQRLLRWAVPNSTQLQLKLSETDQFSSNYFILGEH